MSNLTYKKTFGKLVDLSKIQTAVRHFGAFMSGMIMPVIGVIIAWGIITSLFVSPTSATYNAEMAKIIGPGLRFVIPTLIGFFAGKQVYKIRGAMIGVLATLGTIIGAGATFYNEIAGVALRPNAILDAPVMFLGAMIAAPISALIFKHLEKLWQPKIPQGFEMLVNNFTLGIFGCLFCLGSFWGVTAVVAGIQRFFYISIEALRKSQLIVLMPIFFEPARLLFLNNALDYGIFTPLAINDVTETGKSMFYLFIPNPGPGFGLLLAYYFFSGSKEYKSQTAASIPIQFVGGIHEVYFPFAWLKPLSLPVLILADMFNIWIYSAFNVGSISNNSPGSVISVYSFLAKDARDYLGLTISVFGSAFLVMVSFGLILLSGRIRRGERIIWNPYFSYQNNHYNRLKNTSLFALHAKTPFATLNYVTVPTKKKFLVQSIKYSDKTDDQILLKLKANQLKKFEYYTKNNKKKSTYLIQTYQNNFQWIFWQKNKLLALMHGIKIQPNQTIIKMVDNKKIVNFDYKVQEMQKVYANIKFAPFKNKKNKIVTPKPKKILLAFDNQQLSLKQLNNLLKGDSNDKETNLTSSLKKVDSIIFACEAGMGSSAMGASLLRKMLADNNLKQITVTNSAVKDLENNSDIVVTQKMLVKQAAKRTSAYIYPIDQFLDKKAYQALIHEIKKVKNQTPSKKVKSN